MFVYIHLAIDVIAICYFFAKPCWSPSSQLRHWTSQIPIDKMRGGKMWTRQSFGLWFLARPSPNCVHCWKQDSSAQQRRAGFRKSDDVEHVLDVDQLGLMVFPDLWTQGSNEKQMNTSPLVFPVSNCWLLLVSKCFFAAKRGFEQETSVRWVEHRRSSGWSWGHINGALSDITDCWGPSSWAVMVMVGANHQESWWSFLLASVI